jgi:hypothetical protein
MPTQITWEVASVKCIPEIDGNENVVQQIEWLVTAKTDDFSGSVNGRQDIVYDAANFAPYESLTQPQMIQWVKTAMGSDQVAQFETRAIELAQQIEPQISQEQPITVKLPWEK